LGKKNIYKFSFAKIFYGQIRPITVNLWCWIDTS